MKFPSPAKTQSFTLLEILLAVGIFSGVLVVIYASWSAILRSSRASLDAAGGAHRMRTTMRAIEESIKSAVIFELNLHHYSFLNDTTSDFVSFSLASRLSDSFPGSGLFHDQPIRRVSFTVESKDHGNQLIMRQHPLLTFLKEGEEAYPLVLLEDVDVFALEFWDEQLNDWSPEWIHTNRFPAMIRYTLAAASPDQKAASEDSIVQRVVHVPAATVQARWQRPALNTPPAR